MTKFKKIIKNQRTVRRFPAEMLDDGRPWKKKHGFWKLRACRSATAKGKPFASASLLRLRRCPADGWPAGGLFISSPMSGCGSYFSLPLPLLCFLSFPSCGSFSLSLVLSLSRCSPLFPLQVLPSVYVLVFLLLVISVLLISIPKEKLNPKPCPLNPGFGFRVWGLYFKV
jgi:hypothetical protein